MSTWAHVYGIILIDGIPGNETDPLAHFTVTRIQNILGPIAKWNDLMRDTNSQKACKLPMGSEGSLEYRIIEYDRGFPWLSIPIWGDLRDVDEFDYIKNWWETLIKEFNEKNYPIRGAVMKIDIEGQPSLILHEASVYEKEEYSGKNPT